MNFRHAADELELMASLESGIVFDPEEDRTVQSDVANSDILALTRKYGLRVDSPIPVVDPSFYGDFTGIVDYHTAMQRQVESFNAFMQLPALVRDRFANDPGQLLHFLEDPNNRSEAVELGILEPLPVVPVPEPVPDGQSAVPSD